MHAYLCMNSGHILTLMMNQAAPLQMMLYYKLPLLPVYKMFFLKSSKYHSYACKHTFFNKVYTCARAKFICSAFMNGTVVSLRII